MNIFYECYLVIYLDLKLNCWFWVCVDFILEESKKSCYSVCIDLFI